APVAQETPAATPDAPETPVADATPDSTETPVADATPAADGTPVANAGSTGGDAAVMEDFELAEGMAGYDEVLEMAGSIPPSTPEAVAKGKELYAANCALCHGAAGLGDGDGGASLDPKPRNLTAIDEYKYGHLELALFRTGTYGVEGTGMAPWDGIIAPEDQWAIGHYIRTLQK
ncbi:MAG: c-type cytochrome, partial [Candidatus Eremiobacteraeota bacterium]|nr:c-type cytochrome [Candidatus Eremiobacteraeota bacterium]